MAHREAAIDCARCDARGQGVFRDLDPESVRILTENRTPHRYARGQVLFHEGTPALGVYCIRSGRVKCYKAVPDGKFYILRIAEEGSVLGLESLVSSGSCVMTAAMLDDGWVCFIDRARVLDLLRRRPSAAIAIIDALGREVRVSYTERLDLAYSAVRSRMARLLSLLTETHGAPGDGGTIRIDLPLSREELAEMIGTAPETAIRLLSEFRRLDLIDLRGRSLTVRNRARLVEIGKVDAIPSEDA